MPVTVLNTCLQCGRVFESTTTKNFCSSTCRWAHANKARARTREINAEKKRIEEAQKRFIMTPYFDDVIL